MIVGLLALILNEATLQGVVAGIALGQYQEAGEIYGSVLNSLESL